MSLKFSADSLLYRFPVTSLAKMGALPLQLTLFASCAWAIQFRLPQATNSLDFVLDVKGITPRPTPPPAVRRNLLGWKRASSAEFLGWFAPDNTCGYVQGSLVWIIANINAYDECELLN